MKAKSHGKYHVSYLGNFVFHEKSTMIFERMWALIAFENASYYTQAKYNLTGFFLMRNMTED